jgi:hypothetical protein
VNATQYKRMTYNIECFGSIILSPLLYKGFSNPLLKTLEDEHPGMRIGSVHIASPTCADDILLISKRNF